MDEHCRALEAWAKLITSPAESSKVAPMRSGTIGDVEPMMAQDRIARLG